MNYTPCHATVCSPAKTANQAPAGPKPAQLPATLQKSIPNGRGVLASRFGQSTCRLIVPAILRVWIKDNSQYRITTWPSRFAGRAKKCRRKDARTVPPVWRVTGHTPPPHMRGARTHDLRTGAHRMHVCATATIPLQQPTLARHAHTGLHAGPAVLPSLSILRLQVRECPMASVQEPPPSPPPPPPASTAAWPLLLWPWCQYFDRLPPPPPPPPTPAQIPPHL